MTLQTVKLSQLRLSQLNVRRVKPKAIDQLAADMLAHGQLQNLVVYAESNSFEVAAGGRRYRAFKQLEQRTEERRVGKECVSKLSSRLSRNHKSKNTKHTNL